MNKGIKCYNCNKYAGHITKDCLEPKEEQNDDAKKETGMFVGCMFDYEKEVDNKRNEIDMKSNENKQNKNKDVEDNKKESSFLDFVKKSQQRKLH